MKIEYVVFIIFILIFTMLCIVDSVLATKNIIVSGTVTDISSLNQFFSGYSCIVQLDNNIKYVLNDYICSGLFVGQKLEKVRKSFYGISQDRWVIVN